MIPSSAAITRSTRSIPAAPAVMLWINFSWPGTSISPALFPSPSSKEAKPRSVVIPLRFSSGRRSVSSPVSARIRAVFPWSICPAVPITKCLIICFPSSDPASHFLPLQEIFRVQTALPWKTVLPDIPGLSRPQSACPAENGL